MTALDKVPQNLNYLNPMGFQFTIRKLPNVNFFLQEINIPSVTLPPAPSATPFVTLPYAGDTIEYGRLSMAFKVDEDMRNYRELYEWLRALGFPADYSEYRKLALSTEQSDLKEGIKSDASLLITTNLKNPNIEIVFEDLFPISLSEIRLNTTDSSVDFITCSAEFVFTLFNISPLPK